MNNEIINYANGMGAQDDVINWLNTVVAKYMEENPVEQCDVEHIIDYLCSEKRPKRVSRMSYEQACKNTEKWNNALIKKGSNIKENDSDVETVLDFGDGFRVVRLIGENAYKREGFLMRHCVASFYGRDVEIYSLRDKDNMPHCTMEKNQQIKGKGNGSINPKYIRYVVEFLKHVGMSVGDAEIKNLGYVNVEKIKHKLHSTKNAFFNDNYLFIYDKIYSLDGKKYNQYDLFNFVPLLSVTGKKVTFNYDITAFVAPNGHSSTSVANGYSGTSVANGHSSTSVANGYSGTSVANGHSSTSVANNVCSTSVANNVCSTSVANGHSSTSVANGHSSTSVVNEINSIALCRSYNSSAMGKIGAWLVVAEYDDDNNNIIAIATGKVDGVTIKEDTRYTAKGGTLVECDNG